MNLLVRRHGRRAASCLRGKSSWQKAKGKKGGKGQDQHGKGDSSTCWTGGKARHIAALCPRHGNKYLYAIDEEDNEVSEEARDNDEESEHEPWPAARASLLSVERKHISSSQKIVEVHGRWENVRVTVTCSPRVKLERKTAPKKFVKSKRWATRPFRSRQMRRCTDLQHSGVRALSNLSSRCIKSSELEILCCWLKRIRTFEILDTEQ